MTVMWALVYLAAGAPLAASIPGVYSIVTPINTAAFGWTRNLNFYRFSQLLMTLFLPWAVMEASAASAVERRHHLGGIMPARGAFN